MWAICSTANVDMRFADDKPHSTAERTTGDLSPKRQARFICPLPSSTFFLFRLCLVTGDTSMTGKVPDVVLMTTSGSMRIVGEMKTRWVVALDLEAATLPHEEPHLRHILGRSDVRMLYYMEFTKNRRRRSRLHEDVGQKVRFHIDVRGNDIPKTRLQNGLVDIVPRSCNSPFDKRTRSVGFRGQIFAERMFLVFDRVRPGG